MTGHTKGPWGVHPVKARVDSNPIPVCELLWPTDLRSEAETQANARLIAAAPELLEALEGLFADYKALADSGDAGNWQLEDQSAGIKALAALAKARGEA